MNRKKLVPVGNSALAVPDYMAEHQHEGLEELKNYVVPPRIKVVQKMSREPFDKFGPGDLVAVPDLQLIKTFDKEQKAIAFQCTPIFFWTEWCCWNPLETKGTLPAVRERTLDNQHIIAIKSRDEKRRGSEPCPERPDFKLKYLEHLNFILVIIGDSEFAGLPIGITFASGEHRAGTNFNNIIMRRNAPLYGGQYEAVVRLRKGPKGDWHGIDMDNPRPDTISPWTPKEAYDLFRQKHLEFKDAHAAKLLQLDYGDEALEAEAKPSDSKEF